MPSARIIAEAQHEPESPVVSGRAPEKKASQVQRCCVIGCRSTNEGDPTPYKLFTFTTQAERRNEWIKLINKKAFDNDTKLFKPISMTRVRSKHFIDGLRTGLPILELGYDHPLSLSPITSGEVLGL